MNDEQFKILQMRRELIFSQAERNMKVIFNWLSPDMSRDISLIFSFRNLKSVILLILCRLPSHSGSEWTNFVRINFPDRIRLSSCPLQISPKVPSDEKGGKRWKGVDRISLPPLDPVSKSPQTWGDRKRADAGDRWDGLLRDTWGPVYEGQLCFPGRSMTKNKNNNDKGKNSLHLFTWKTSQDDR